MPYNVKAKDLPGLPPPFRIPKGPVPRDTAAAFEALQYGLFGKSAAECVRQFVCIDDECGRMVTPNSFRTQEHRRCYEITGLCNHCQDELAKKKLGIT